MYMKLKFKNILLTSLLFHLLCFSVFADEAGIKPKIYCNLPLTGAHATYGQAVYEGTKLANLDFKDEAINYNFADNESLPKQALSVFRSQMLDKPDIYISGVKPEHLAYKDLLVKENIPHFAWVFDINLRPVGEPNFRTWVNFKIEPAVIIDYTKRSKAKTVTIIGGDLPTYHEEYDKFIIPGLKEQEIEIKSHIIYPIDKTEFRDIATKVKQTNTDLYILAGFQENLMGLLKAMNQLNIIKDGNTIATYDLLDAAPYLHPRFTEGVRVVSPRFLLTNNSEYNDWKKRFKELFNKEPLYSHAYAYDMALALREAIRIKSKNSGISWESALMQVDTEGITGKVKFDNTGDLAYELAVGVYRNGKLSLDY
jgi:branched-chain amino acid transport system substrate-binding protein